MGTTWICQPSQTVSSPTRSGVQREKCLFNGRLPYFSADLYKTMGLTSLLRVYRYTVRVLSSTCLTWKHGLMLMLLGPSVADFIILHAMKSLKS